MAYKFLKEILISKKEGINTIDIGEDVKNTNKGKCFLDNIEAGRVNIIAEIKKASPSRGIINRDLNVTDTAKTYDRFSSFISGLSVLTEELYFKGDAGDIVMAKKGTRLPILRKDFIFSHKQVYESAALGADCILLIKSLLGFKKLKILYKCARKAGLDVLIETHHKEEFLQALELDAELIGINNRDLKKMKVDSGHIISVLKDIPAGMLKGRKIICESGVKDIDYIEMLYGIGINTFLIGTHFMASTGLEDTLSVFEEDLSRRGLI